MFNIVALIIGIIIFCGGLYYLLQNKADKESRNIYIITIVVGLIIVLGVICKMIMF